MKTAWDLVGAVDGGGTKTLAIVCDRAGSEIARASAGPSNYVAGEAGRVTQNVRGAVEEAVAAARLTLPLAALWVGLAGIDRPGAREEIEGHLRSMATDLRLTNDAQLLFGALPDEVGVALIAGTGSIALAVDRQGVTARAAVGGI